MTISDERDMVTTRLNKLIANSEGGWYKDPNVKLLQSQDNNQADTFFQEKTHAKPNFLFFL